MSAAGEKGDLLRQATDLHRQGRLDEAEQLYGRLLDAKPQHFDALHRLAIVAMQRGDFDTALSRIDHALRVTPTSASATLNRGSILVALKRYGDALAAYDCAVEFDGDDPDTHYNRANVLKEMGRPEQALASYEEVIKRRPNDAEAHFNSGRMLFELRRFEEAVSSYDQAIAVCPSTEIYFHRGNALKGLLRLEEAVSSYSQAIALNPGNISAHLNRANALRDLKRPDDALATCEEVLVIKPGHAEAHFNRGNALLDLRRFEDALASFDTALTLRPDFAEALSNRGAALLALKRPDEALACYDQAFALKPDQFETHFSRGTALLKLNRPEHALASFDRTLALKPDHTEALIGRADALMQLNRPTEALWGYEKALALKPDHVEALNNRGNALLALNRPADALSNYQKALALKPGYAAAINNRGCALLALKRPHEALASFDEALAINPHYVEAINNRGKAFFDLKRFDDALVSFDRALAIEPEYAKALYNRGSALSQLKRYEQAGAAYRAALAIQPKFSDALALLGLAHAHSCNWADWKHIEARLRTSIQAGTFDGVCFGVLTSFDDPEIQRKAAVGHCTQMVGALTRPTVVKPVTARKKLRIGYLSADFKAHAITFLTTGMIEAHNRSFCEVVGFSAAADDGSPQRKRLTAALDRFIDVGTLSDDGLCGEIGRAEIDILVDLGGYTQDSRMLALAQRPAPIQISYLGYPGTTGAPFIDYIIADPFVIPADAAQHYAEQVVYLPDCFQGNDDKRPVAPSVPTRGQCGLPDGGFVFCAFHNAYKISPGIFDIWMRLLEAVPGSVIWLTAGAEAHANLCREAAARRIDPARLVFAGPVPYPEHLARQKLADLFIDAWPYNGGTTASDALWVGLPVLTLAGRSYAARMAGSLLHAIGLPELVTHASGEYEALALRLAREPALLNAVRGKLAANIRTAPLFDTARFTRNMEAAYARMWEMHRRGERPRSFSVQPVAAQANSSYQPGHNPNPS